ncbi:MAG: ATP-binding cassette domain-containing protein, partial [Chitinophagales bacterium]
LIQPGTITWVCGKQGSGKSSLLKLIQGIYVPGNGNIFLDEWNYAALAPNAIRKNVTIVSNAAPLIGSTVFKAISYSQTAEKREKAEQLLERLGFHTGGSTEAVDYHLHDLAKNLSNGQRRLLMFARAFLTRKKVILIDDGFDDLDKYAREKVILELQKLKSKRTVIIASSQLPGEILVDQILNLSELHPKIQQLVP